MNKIILNDDGLTFEATVLKAARPARQVLFAAGSGGDPARYLPLLTSLVGHNCNVIAPHFERLAWPGTTVADLILRARKLKIALDYVADSKVPAVGLGHSIGATLLIAMAGGQMWMQEGQFLPIPCDERLKRLVLFTPPTDFFQAPNALSGIQVPIQVWAGTLDTVTPPAQAEFIRRSLHTKILLDVHTVDGAGHFSFMNEPPPQITDPMIDRDAFLTSLAKDVRHFIMT